jgi:ubiquinone/menaquinone biosynthesis C-methylase UbiE
VGPAGKVYANDIQPRMLELLRQNMAQRKIANVETVLGAVDDPKLPSSSVDLELMIDVYHEFSHPQEMLRHLRDALKPGGRMVLLEYRGEDPAIPILPAHKMTVAMVKSEVEPEGFRLDKTIEALPRQHILIFKK